MTKCIVPPVLKPLNCDIAKVSATIPCPATAASPWISKAITLSVFLSFDKVCFALTFPTTTGFTASKCDGFEVNDKWIFLFSNSLSVDTPKWYFTSPDPRTSFGSLSEPWNFDKIFLYDISKTLESNVSLPLCAVPIIISSIPDIHACFTICSIPGIIDSPPSIPYLFVPKNFLSKNCSNNSDSTILL